MRTIDDVAPLGVGMVWLPRLHAVVDPAALDVLEIEPQLNWVAPGDDDRAVTANDDFITRVAQLGVPTLLHSVGLPVGNTAPPPGHDLERLAEDARILDPRWVSEHLSFDTAVVRGEVVWTGFLLPPPQTDAAVRVAAMRLCALREALQRPVAFETGVNYFDGARDVLADGAFFAAVAQAADCGILLDLHNLWVNERNGRMPVECVVDALPLERVWELHLAGGQTHRGVYLDAHAGLVDPQLLALAERIVPRLPALRAIILEAVPLSLRNVAPAAIRAQLDALRALWTRRGSAARATRRSVVVTPALPTARDLRELADDANVLATALAAAHTPRDGDRVALVAELVREARGGALLRALPLTTRLLLAELGGPGFVALLERYAAAVAPHRFPNEEARRFLAFLERAGLDVPYLADITRLERAIVDATTTGSTHVVRFPTALEPVMAALLERRRPPALPAFAHVVRVRPNGILIRRARFSRPLKAAATGAAAVRRRSTAAAFSGSASARS